MRKKPGKWLRNFLTGKKDNHKEKCNNGDQNSLPVVVEIVPTTPISITPTTPKEKRRWSFRRSSAAPKDSNSNPAAPTSTTTQVSASSLASLDCEDEQKKHEMAMEAATAVAAAAVIRLTSASATTNNGQAAAVEEAAATKIQSIFRSYLARKALCALRGLVKLQALVRGHLVRKQATATLRCMQALVTAQARARAQRIRMVQDGNPISSRPPSPHRKSAHQENRYRHLNYEIDKGMEENIKIVEMDQGDPSRGAIKGRNSYSHNPQPERPTEPRLSVHYPPSNRSHSKQDVNYLQASPAPSAITDFSPRACSSHFEDLSFGTTQSSPQCYSAMSKPDPSRVPFAFQQPDYSEPLSYDYPLFPNYMANTQSSRAKARSQSAPKQRPPDSLERQLSRRRISLEGRNVPRAVRMQRSSSQAGSVAQNYQYPWSIKLDRSAVSLKDSECGSTSTVLTNANYCRSLVGFDIHGERY